LTQQKEHSRWWETLHTSWPFLAVAALIALGVLLMPSPWGRLTWGGWEAEQRAALGSALLTGAIIGLVLLVAERVLEDQRQRAADQERTNRIQGAARAVDQTLVRYVDALQGAWLQALRVYKEQAIEHSEQTGSELNTFWAGGLTELHRPREEVWTVSEVESVLKSADAFVQIVPFGQHPRLTDAHLHLHAFMAGLLEGSHARPLTYVAPAPHEEAVRLLPWTPELEEMWVTTQRAQVSPDLGAVVDLVVADVERAISSLYLASPQEVRPLLDLRDRVFSDWRRRTRWERRYRWAAPTLRLAAVWLHKEFESMELVGRVPVRDRLRPEGAEAGWWNDRRTRQTWLWNLREVARAYDAGTPEAAVMKLLGSLPDVSFDSD
jgi:hypothetical protein